MTDRIETLLDEQRTFPPPAAFRAQAHVRDDSVYQRARADREAYWADWARQLEWIRPWDRVLEWTPPYAKWFVGGKLNASANCLDRQVRGGKKDKVALIWEGEPGEVRRITYGDLLRDVCRCANALKNLGVRKGDRVAIYMPMVPEVAVAMLACARLGAVHTVVFGGFSSESLRDRINDAEAKVLITADGGYRRGSQVPLKQNADEALAGTPSIRHVIVLKRTGQQVAMKADRDQWWDPLVTGASTDCPPEPMDAEDPLFILYTSGTTGKPKGILHTTGGYLTQVYATTKWVFDLKDSDVFWCTADVGWVTGHSYVVYGPLAVGVTQVMYEGAPDHPAKDRFWALCARHGVTVFYTAPTAIRSFMKWGTELPAKHDLTKIRLLGSVGEPINPEAWIWYHENIGGKRCPIVDTWWQTETGGIMITPLPGVTTTKPGSGTVAFPGIDAVLLDGDGKEVQVGGGYLAITSPWPGMLRTIWRDDERYRSVYWSRWANMYFPGDGAKRDTDGYFWILGRVDDVLNVAGHRIGTMEVESALVDHPAVAEAAVVGRTHDLKGQALAAFVTIKEGRQATDALKDELKAHVAKKIGALARPDDIIYAADLPKTRSGKIMRRLLKDIAEGRALGDTTTLADPAVVQKLKVLYEDKE
ncbi:MAG TPA: acetate--CoA ligase [Gemmatimonadales bacterium]|jgi:acetyl-CoA synthetase|nr:acetate--CoA ligase [Gemmatimonadales bacterium]